MEGAEPERHGLKRTPPPTTIVPRRKNQKPERNSSILQSYVERDDFLDMYQTTITQAGFRSPFPLYNTKRRRGSNGRSEDWKGLF
mmetsp:Transcript_3696/g.8790  ORF Transcript_3696/g.8790 Transcript_3696/m.8790 type:complete len:85 (+) Transcript_3696:512-766(+)